MEFRILGPIDVRNEAGAVALGGKKPRAVLAVLLLHANEPVSAERLALALWGEDAPGAAVKTVQVHVSRLRKALGDHDAVATTAAGYTLRVGRDELDAERFERLADEGRTALADGRPEHAAALLRDALALWRGAPLAELADEPFAAAEIGRLEEQRLAALEARIEADLAAGRHGAVVGELQRLVGDNPTRERLAGQLMLALYRCGRQAEALDAYTQARAVLVSEIGVEPGPELRRLQDAILRQDAALEPQAAPARLPPELDTGNALPLAGRERERAWIGEHWKRARGGAGGLVTMAGPRGIGKSRLAAEVAGEYHRGGAAVLYIAWDGPAQAALDTLERVRAATVPTLVVADDADRGGAELQAALEGLVPALAALPVLVLATGQNPRTLAGLGAREMLALRPLTAAEIASLAQDYAPGMAPDELPVEWLLEASAGFPRQAHQVAGQWARREAARRVGAVAGRAAAGRAELRSIEAELAGDVADLQAAGERAGRGGGAGGPVVCPFKGLASFDVADAQYFFGRDRLTAQLVARLVGAPLLGIVGPSGSGKSSVLRAGLLPALASGVLPGSEALEQLLIRPGAHPLAELRSALDGAGARRVVIAVDQFEETFTACADEDERAAFVAALVAATAGGADARCTVVLALRADFYGRCAAYPELAGMLAANHVLVGPMHADELRRAVDGPARRAGLRVDPELTDGLVRDVEGEPGALPMLSTALLELWQRREGRRLSLNAYERSGGVRGAVARLAEEAFGQLGEEQQRLARGVLMRLVGEGAAGGVERRRVPLEELETLRSEDVARVVALLTDRRLLTVSAGTVELAHEALLREWPRLRRWIEEDRDGLRIQRNLNAAAHEWARLHRDEGALYRGGRLTEVLEWQAAGDPPLNDLERAFVTASEARRSRDRATRRRRTVLSFSSLLALLAAISVVAIVSVSDSHRSQRQRDVAASRELAARAVTLLQSDPELGRLVALAAHARRDTPEARAAVRQAALEDRTLAVLPADPSRVTAVATGAGGRLAASGGDGGEVRVWDVGRRRLAGTIKGHKGTVWGVAFSPDARRIATASEDGTVAIAGIDGSARRVLLRIAGAEAYPYRVDFSPDGRTLAVGARDGSVRLVDVAAGTSRRLGRHDAAVDSVAFDPSGGRVVSGGDDGVARIWDVRSGASTALPHGSAGVNFVAFSPDGRRVATVTSDGRLRIWEALGARTAIAPIKVAANGLNSVRYSPDGRRLVVASDDGVVRIFDARNGARLADIRGIVGIAFDAAFAAGGTIVTAGEDGALRIVAPPATAAIPSFATTPSFADAGRRVVFGDYAGRANLWNPGTGADATFAASPNGAPALARESADGRRVVSAAFDGTVRLYDTRTRRTRAVPADAAPKSAVAIDRAGRRVAIAGAGPPVVESVTGGGRVLLKQQRGGVTALTFSPDGRRVASASDDGAARIFDAATGRLVRTLRGHADTVTYVAYSPDGALIATAGSDSTIRVWHVSGGPPTVLFGHQAAVNSATFDGQGDRVVSASEDGTVRVWDAADGDLLVVLERYRSANGAGFTADGRRVVSTGDDGNPAGGVVKAVACDTCGSFDAALALARSRATRRLSSSDRHQLLAGS